MATTNAICSLLLALTSFAAVAHAQTIPTGQNGTCCVFAYTRTNTWQLVCNNPTNVPGALLWPDSLINRLIAAMASIRFSQCTGMFRMPPPIPYLLPPPALAILTATPNGLRCANPATPYFLQVIRPDGVFQVQCTSIKPPAARRAASAFAKATSVPESDAGPSTVAASANSDSLVTPDNSATSP